MPAGRKYDAGVQLRVTVVGLLALFDGGFLARIRTTCLFAQIGRHKGATTDAGNTMQRLGKWLAT